jgi:hypothetical protein
MRLHIQADNNDHAVIDAGKRVATIRPDHFNGLTAIRKIWFAGPYQRVCLKVFGQQGRLYACDWRCLRKGSKQEDLEKAASVDEIGLLEARDCLQMLGADHPSRTLAGWAWPRPVLADVLRNGLLIERQLLLDLIPDATVHILEIVADELAQIQPQMLGNLAEAFIQRLHDRAVRLPEYLSPISALLNKEGWVAFAAILPAPDLPNGSISDIEEALRNDVQDPRWPHALRYVAKQMPVGRALDLLIAQTHRQVLHGQSQLRTLLFEQIGVLLRRLDWSDLEQHTRRIIEELIQRPAFSLAERTSLLVAYLESAEKTTKGSPYDPEIAPAQLQCARFFYALWPVFDAWCNELPTPPAPEQAKIAARAAKLCANVQAQPRLMHLLENVSDAPTQVAVIGALEAIRAEDTHQTEPLAHRLGDILRRHNRDGIHQAALRTLEKYVPYPQSRHVFELILDSTNNRDGLAHYLPDLVDLVPTHALFDLNDIASNALRTALIEHPNWRVAILDAWGRAPDPQLLRGTILLELPKNPELRRALRDKVPNNADYAPFRDWLDMLDERDRIAERQKMLLNRLGRLCTNFNQISTLNLRPPANLTEVNSFLSEISGQAQILHERLDQLMTQISQLRQQDAVYWNVQEAQFTTLRAGLNNMRNLLNNQLRVFHNGLNDSGSTLRELQNQLRQLRGEQNLSGEVQAALRDVEQMIDEVQGSRQDTQQKINACQNARSRVEQQLQALDQIMAQAERNPNAQEIQRLETERNLIQDVLRGIEPEIIDEINAQITEINRAPQELRQRIDQALAEWNREERRAAHRSNYQTQIAERQRRMRELLLTRRRDLERRKDVYHE